MNRQFMAVLKERRELDRERREMIAAAVEVWKTLSGAEYYQPPPQPHPRARAHHHLTS